ncbi:MAG: hypothetical protein Kow0090_04400 [Myxococcota bacterium]
MQNIINISEAANLAIHSLAYLASGGNEGYVSVSEIARELGVSESHLAKVMQKLVKKGYIRSSRGAKGGFSFIKKPSDIFVLDVMRAIDGAPSQNGCILGDPVCSEGRCAFMELAIDLDKALIKHLGKMSIKEIRIEKRDVRQMIKKTAAK